MARGGRGAAAGRLWGVREASGAKQRGLGTQHSPRRMGAPGSLSRLTWITPLRSGQHCDLHQGRVSWFLGRQLKVAVNCLARHVHVAPDKVALIWEKDELGEEVRVTYSG
uniref:Uncharacterized protein n=1 Tax=Falco tinnunculus TaxID=100819 RepID=A0A8C4V037_FALTI